MSKAKITLSVDGEIVTAAKIRALQDGTSVSEAVSAFLQGWAARQDQGSDPEHPGHWDKLQARIRELEAALQQSTALLERLAAQARSWAAGGGETPAMAVLTTLAAYQAPPPGEPQLLPLADGWQEAARTGDYITDKALGLAALVYGSGRIARDSVFADVTVPAEAVPQMAQKYPEAFTQDRTTVEGLGESGPDTGRAATDDWEAGQP